MMGRKRQDVTDAELAVLQALWDRGPATLRQLSDALYPGGGASQYATVKKLLARLEAKRCVRRDRGGAVQVFAAAIRREELIGRRLQSLADSLCDGDRTPLLMHLLQDTPATPEELRELRALLAELIRDKRRT